MEVVWAAVTPKNLTKDSIVKKIIVGAIYVKPHSKKKSATVDHIAEVHSMLTAKYGRGLFWILAGDTNDLKLGPLLRINSKFKSVVKKPTRIYLKNPKQSSILDNIIIDMHRWYQEPECLPPINSDTEKGKPSDHLTVVFTPINVINNIPLRAKRRSILRPITDAGLNLFQVWIEGETWKQIVETHDINMKTTLLFQTLKENINQCFHKKCLSTHQTTLPGAMTK